MIAAAEIEEAFYTASAVSGESGAAAVRFLQSKGVSINPVDAADVVTAAHIVSSGKHFEIAKSGDETKRAILILCRDYWQPIDIAAWLPAAGQILTWCGQAAALGEEQIYGARLDGGLHAFREPLAWFLAGRQGIVILNARATAARLDGLGPLIAEDADHAQWLQRNLARPAPKILVPNPARKAA